MRKLDIGPQNKRIDSTWETLDILPGENIDIVADIMKPLPIENNTYDLIYMSHVLEHVPWYETVKVLRELYRILKVGGSIEVYVPDIDKIIEAYKKEVIPDQWYKYNESRDPFLWFVGRIFTYGEHPSDFHKAAFNNKYLRKCLGEAGFVGLHNIHNPRSQDHGYINLGVAGFK